MDAEEEGGGGGGGGGGEKGHKEPKVKPQLTERGEFSFILVVYLLWLLTVVINSG